MNGYVPEERFGVPSSIGPVSSMANADGYGIVSSVNTPLLASGASPPLRKIQIIERWDFARGCLAFWLRQACPDYEVVVTPDVRDPGEDECQKAVALVVGRETMHLADDWLEHELARLRQISREVPVVAIMSTDLLDKADILTKRFGLSGFILTSDSVEVASAALRLVMAGGTHFPRAPTVDPARPRYVSNTSASPGGSLPQVHLTLKEKAVMDCLGRGNPNKVIAHELNMSLSTVKAHVHRIIRKLNVNNRTAVAVAAQSIRGMTGRGQEI